MMDRKVSVFLGWTIFWWVQAHVPAHTSEVLAARQVRAGRGAARLRHTVRGMWEPLLQDPTPQGGALPIWSLYLAVQASSFSLHNVWGHSGTTVTREILGIFLERTIRWRAAAASKFSWRKGSKFPQAAGIPAPPEVLKHQSPPGDGATGFPQPGGWISKSSEP